MQQHWQVVNSGQTTVSSTPKELWDNACKYFKWCDDNPVATKKTAMSGREVGKVISVEQPRPYSIKALCLHCGILEEYLRDLRKSKDESSMYYIVVSKILYIIYIQNMEYATLDVFNPIFTSKILGMEPDDSGSRGITVTVMQGLPELSKSENEILEKLELEMKLTDK